MDLQNNNAGKVYVTRQAAAEKTEEGISKEEREVLHLAERDKFNEVVDETAADVEKDTVKVKVYSLTYKDAKTSEKDVSDEVCPDSEYGSETSPDDSKANSKPPEVLPPPVRDRKLGGIDYYSLTYDDPIFDDEDF